MNPMQGLLAFPGQLAQTGQGVSTGQPAIGYTREAQWGKYFCYVLQYLPLPSGSVRLPRSFSVDGSYDFLVQKPVLLSDNGNGGGGGILLQTQVSPLGEFFEQLPIYASQWGSGQYPEITGNGIPEVLPRNATFTLLATDGQNPPANTTVILALHGTKTARQVIVPKRHYPLAKPFKYPATFDAFTTDNNGNPTGPIGPGQSGIYTVTIDQDSDFEVQKITVVSDTTVTVQVNSDSDNWFLFPLRSDLLGGSLLEFMPTQGQLSGEHPFALPGARLITGAGYITVTVANLDTQNSTRAQVVFHGVRIYPAGGHPA